MNHQNPVILKTLFSSFTILFFFSIVQVHAQTNSVAERKEFQEDDLELLIRNRPSGGMTTGRRHGT